MLNSPGENHISVILYCFQLTQFKTKNPVNVECSKTPSTDGHEYSWSGAKKVEVILLTSLCLYLMLTSVEGMEIVVQLEDLVNMCT